MPGAEAPVRITTAVSSIDSAASKGTRSSSASARCSTVAAETLTGTALTWSEDRVPSVQAEEVQGKDRRRQARAKQAEASMASANTANTANTTDHGRFAEEVLSPEVDLW
jgi:hypothetical protein